MSWSDSHPVLTDQMIEDYEAEASAAEIQNISGLYASMEILNAKRGDHIVSVSLVASDLHDGRENASKSEEPWSPEHENLQEYIAPLLAHARRIESSNSGHSLRVHLENGLGGLAPSLLESGCEVWLMGSAESSPALGKLWRLLALRETDSLVTVTSMSRLADLEADMTRTKMTALGGLRTWRTPGNFATGCCSRLLYSPFSGAGFGAKGGLDVSRLLQAFTWHTWQGSMPNEVHCPSSAVPLHGPAWTSADFDEWFIAAAIYPRLAADGILTFAPARAMPPMFALDVEYCTWANPNSQLIHVPISGGCTDGGPREQAPGLQTTAPAPGRDGQVPATAKSVSLQERETLSVGVVTLWTPEIKDWCARHAEDKATYCSRWGLNFYPYEDKLDHNREPTWSKIIALQKHLPSHDWLFWTDADTVITNNQFDIRALCDNDYDLIITHDHAGFNAGAFFIRNTPYGHEFLRRVWENNVRTFHYEQTAMIAVMATMPELRVKIAPKNSFNSYWFEHRPGDFIFHAAGEHNGDKEKFMRIFANAAIPLSPELLEAKLDPSKSNAPSDSF